MSLVKNLKNFTVVTTYFFSSIATFNFNKYITKYMGFEMHFMLVVLQSAIISLIIAAQMLISTVKVDFRTCSKWIVTSILLGFMMFTGIKITVIFTFTTMSMYKNLTIIVIAVLEYLFFSRPLTIIACFSFVIMLYSSIFGNSIESVTLKGYLWMAGNIAASAAYALYIKKLMVIDRSQKIESVFFTNLFSIPLVLTLSLATERLYFPPFSFKLVFFILLSSVTAYLTSFSTAWVVSALSSTTFAMIGGLNKLVLSATDYIFFDSIFSKSKTISLFIGIAASVVYSLDQIKIKRIEEVNSNQNPAAEQAILEIPELEQLKK